MAIVTYCQIVTATGVCTDKFEWDDTNTYTPPSGYSLAPNGDGEIGWTWTGTAWSYGTSTPSAGAIGTFSASGELDYLGDTGAFGDGDMIYYSSGAANLINLPMGVAGTVLTSSSGIPTWLAQTGSITFIIDGGGSAITAGEKGDITIPFNCTITQWTLLADQSGSITVDIWKDTYANYPPVVGDSITGSGTKPNITSSTKGQSSSFTGWSTVSITAGDVLAFNVEAGVSTVQRVTLSLTITRP